MRTAKIAALVAATALLVVGAAFAAMAATGWVEEAGSWKYYDKNGDMVTETFKQSGDNWYYLDADGNMATEALVDYNSNYYWVDETGKMVKNQWVKVPNTDNDEKYGDYIYYYFQSSGKAYKGSDGCTVKTINGKKYVFDDAGKMRYGWLNAGYEWSSNDEGKEYEDAVYYCGGADDGARLTSKWIKLSIVNSDNDDTTAWFYFDNKGEKVANSQNKSINGKKYVFDENGVMQSEWASVLASGSTESTSSISSYGWFNDAESGKKLVKGWTRQVPQANVNPDDNDAETAHWFYADKNGEFYKSAIKSINGKTYGFNDEGEMVSGLQYCALQSDGTYKFLPIDADNIAYFTSLDGNWEGVDDGEKSGVRFFSADEEKDGSMKTGSVKVDVDGDEYNFKFATKGVNKGVGRTGKDGNYYYLNGCKITADGDARVQAFKWTNLGTAEDPNYRAEKVVKTVVSEDGSAYTGCVLVTNSGNIVKSGTKTDGDGFKFKVSNYEILSCTYSE